MRMRIIGGVFLILAVFIVGFVAYENSTKRQIPLVFSAREMLNSLWEQYKMGYLEPGTFRTLDKQRENITTSEGQSYTMLRAVWLDDKDTFDKSWRWTKNNLQRQDDHLFSWLFGKKVDGKYGIITEKGGANTASDADVDIALALLFAHYRWNEDSYLHDAKPIIADVWDKEVVMINGRPYLAANNLEKGSKKDHIVMNPSYLAPYAYRIFAKVDHNHQWMKLVDTSYEVLEKSMASSLGSEKSVGLPPNWVAVDIKTGSLKPTGVSYLDTHYSYDALRVSWRIALDHQWYEDRRALSLLKKMSFLSDEWTLRERLQPFTHDGKILSPEESPALYGGSLGHFMVEKPSAAENVYLHKLQILYNPDTQSWKKSLGYYDENWAWFGIALYNRALPNLSL